MTAPPMTARLAGLSARLREQVASGFFTPGGGSVSFHGKGEMWGGEPIMVARNPDGAAAATAIEDLLARNAALESALEDIRLTIEDEAYKVTEDQQPCKHTDVLNEIHEIASTALTLKENEA